MGTIDNSNNIEAELQKQLKETSLSENEINEIVPKILELINLKENIENKQTETSTQNFLLDLRQDITNNSNVAIDIKKNKGTVIGTIEVNNIRNDIHITVNGPQTELKSEQSKPTVTEQKPTVTEQKPTVTEQKPTVTEQKPTVTEQKPAVTEQKPTVTTTEQSKPTVTEQKPAVTEQKPTVTEQKPTVERIETPEYIDNKLEDLNQKELRTPEGYMIALNNLLYEIENAKSGIVKKGLSKDCKQSLKISKQNLETLEKQINTIKTSIMRQRNPEISETYINRFNTFKNNIGIIKNDIDSAISGIPKNSTFFYGSIRDAERSNKQLEKINKLKSRLKEAVKELAILSIFNQEEQKAIDFYTRIIEGTYTPEDFKLYKEHEGTFNPSFQRCGIELPILDPSQIQTMGGTSGMGQQSIQAIDIRNINRGQGTPQGGIQLEQGVQTTRQRKPKIDYSNMDLGEAFQAGGLAGVLDKALSNCKNMTPGQRDARKSIGVLSGYAAGIYGLYKFYTSKQSFLTKAGITAAAIFGAQALTGEGPISLFTKAMTGGFSANELQDKFGNAFGDAVTGVSSSGMECAPTLSGSMYSMMIFNSTTTVGDIRAMTSSFKNNNAWKAFREDAINKLKSKYGENSAQYFSTNFPETFDEQKRNTWLASFGITNSAPDSTTKVYEIANNASMNELIIEKFKEQNGVKETSNEVKKKEFNNYINSLKPNNQSLDIKTLEAHPEWFELDTKATYTERQVDKDFKSNIESKIDTLPIDEPKKSELKSAIKRFYDERSIEAKPIKDDFSLSMEDNLLVLTSHEGQKTKINIKLNKIEGFGNAITFSDLSDLLNTADLANKILAIQKGKTPKSSPAFQYKTGTGGRGIYFNDASTRSFNFDTRVLSGGRGGAIGKIDTLSQHPDDFAKYLSDRRAGNNRIDTSTTNYPILQNLSKSGIEFFNEEEAKQAEARLNQVKENRKTANGGPAGYKPFSIEGNKLVFTTLNKKKLYFPDSFSNDFSGKNQDLSAFPTILENKDIVLAYMNNKSNGMRGSALKKK